MRHLLPYMSPVLPELPTLPCISFTSCAGHLKGTQRLTAYATTSSCRATDLLKSAWALKSGLGRRTVPPFLVPLRSRFLESSFLLSRSGLMNSLRVFHLLQRSQHHQKYAWQWQVADRVIFVARLLPVLPARFVGQCHPCNQ